MTPLAGEEFCHLNEFRRIKVISCYNELPTFALHAFARMRSRLAENGLQLTQETKATVLAHFLTGRLFEQGFTANELLSQVFDALSKEDKEMVARISLSEFELFDEQTVMMAEDSAVQQS
jgi:hypothetical protein